jgi:hypothetical protein
MDWIYAVAVVVFNTAVLWFWKPWSQAYSGEKGKHLARKEDLEKILAEVRVVTATQKEIESRISGALWDRQWRLNHKLDIYSRALRAISDYMVWLLDHSENAKFSTDNTTTKECGPIAEEFYSAYAVVPLFVSEESMVLIEETIKPEFFYHSSVGFKVDQYGERADEAHGKLASARAHLIASARRDLER